MIAVREYTNAADMIEAAKARRAAFFPQPRGVVIPLRAVPEPATPPPPPPPVLVELPRLPLPQDRFVKSCLALAPDGVMKPARWLVILRMVVEETGIPMHEIKGETRVPAIARARQIGCYLLRKHTHLSFPLIGERLGGRDHTTVLHGCRRVAVQMESDDDLRDLVDRLTVRILLVLGPLEPLP